MHRCLRYHHGFVQFSAWPDPLRFGEESGFADAGRAQSLHWKRLRIIGYGVALVLMTAYLVYSMATRGSFDRAINQVRQPLYVVLSNGDIRNRYQIRITNKAGRPRPT